MQVKSLLLQHHIAAIWFVFHPYDTHMWFLCEVWIFIFVFIVGKCQR
jgi:hypothetical protein